MTKQAETSLTLHIEGMDCPSCAGTIEKAVCKLPGVKTAAINFTNGKIRLDLHEGGPDAGLVTQTITKLGYQVARPEQDKEDRNSGASPTKWYQGKKGRLVVFTGTMLVLATLVYLIARTAVLPVGGYALPFYEVGFALAALVAVWPLARKAWRSARAGSPFTIETLVTLAVAGAIAIGASAEAAVVVFLFAVGEMLESLAAARARKNVEALADLAPKTALLVDGKNVHEVSADSLAIGDIIEVRPGGRVPADGEIVQGETSLDESALTGESIPVRRGVGDQVFAGTINADGVIRVRVEKTSADNMVAKIMTLVEEAEAAKAPTARFIDDFSRYYTPGVLAVGILIACVPPLLFGAAWMPWIYKGLAILLIGCPCALVLSTPAAITSGIASGARRGLLIKGGVVLEAIGKVKTIAFDKTGTLTAGTPKVTDVHAFTGKKDNMLALAAAIEASSSHPLALAIVESAKARHLDIPIADNAKALSGRGVAGYVGVDKITIASPRYAAELTRLGEDRQAVIQNLEEDGKTIAVILKDKEVLGVIALRDELREDAALAMDKLKKMQIETIMLTGDNALTGQALAGKLGIDVEAELMPQDKLAFIEQLKQNGTIAMVGDGINDAPALARADVGVAMGGGTDVALETADAALLREQVTGIPALVRLSRATLKNIHQNIGFALMLKAIFLITTLFGATSLWMAILADTGATVIVTLNALRLLKFDPHK